MKNLIKYQFPNDLFQKTYVALEDYEELMEYCNKLVDFLPCLPADVDNLRAANGHFAQENDRLRNRLYRLGECPDCEQEVSHWGDEPFASCACGAGEDCSGPSVLQELRQSNARLTNDNECLKRDCEIYESQVRFLQERLEKERKEKKYYISIVKEDAEAASIFQPDGKYAKEANVRLGDSTVVEGIKWMDGEIDRLKQQSLNQSISFDRSASRWTSEAMKLQNEIVGWKKKWESAVEMAAIAENKLDDIRRMF